MHEKRMPFMIEEPKYRKKSKKSGLPRADHKHEYKTVLLHRNLDFLTKPNTTSYSLFPNKVCTICGRIGDIDYNQYEFVKVEHPVLKNLKEKKIKNPEILEKWYCDKYLDKFAYRKD